MNDALLPDLLVSGYVAALKRVPRSKNAATGLDSFDDRRSRAGGSR